MNKLLKKNKNAIKKILKKSKETKEGFVNFKYTDDKQRGLDNFKFTGLING